MKTVMQAEWVQRLSELSFETIGVSYNPETYSLWMLHKEDGPSCYTPQMLGDMLALKQILTDAISGSDGLPVRYFVSASRKPGIYNLGGDLALFSRSIRDNDEATLKTYAHACVDAVHSVLIAFGLPLITLSVIAGQALGGGLEAALAHDFIFAEESARLGVPEVAFNTFPGMGAVSLLGRRLGEVAAEELMSSGKVYSGTEMYNLGVVDHLAHPGQGEQAAIAWMKDADEPRFQRRYAIAQARRRCFPVSYNELIRITDVWAACSCAVTAKDLRHMERLVAAQEKMAHGPALPDLNPVRSVKE
jgi:DSF synthase